MILSVAWIEVQAVRIVEKSDLEKIDTSKVVSLGVYSQHTADITGAVSTISGYQLDKSPVATLSLALANQLPGLMSFENSSQLTFEQVLHQIRGRHTGNGTAKPIILVDGILVASNIYDIITPAEIESISILKDASTQAVYGIRGANGVIVINTKRGNLGRLNINTTLENSVQQVTTKPTFFNSGEYATLRNEAYKNDGKPLPYTDEQIAKFKSGEDREKYPNTNWYDMFMNKFIMQQRVNISASAGSDKVKFFANLNYINQGSQFKSDNDNYEATDATQLYNFRTNIDIDLFKNLSVYYRTSGSIRKKRTPPGYTMGTAYQSLFTMPSVVYGPKTPEGQVIATSEYNDPTYAILNRAGYAQTTSANLLNQFGLDLNLSPLIKGLKLGGFVSYETFGSGYLSATQSFERWKRTDNFDEFTFIKKGDEINTPLKYSKFNLFQYKLIFNGNATYNRKFGKNEIGSMVYGEFHNYSSPSTNGTEIYPYKHILSGLMLNYNFDKRYYGKIDIGYSGSDQFPNENRFFLTPAFSAGWVVSNEAFLANNNVLSHLKLRGSYGHTANDDFGASRYSYLDEVVFVSGGPIGNLQYLIAERMYGNKKVSPEIIKKQNYGVDIEFFKSLSFNIDYFKEAVDNMYINSTTNIPGFQGIPLANYPFTNLGKMKNEGFDISANYSKQLNQKLSITLGAMFSATKNRMIEVGEAQLDETFAYRYRSQGYAIGQGWGYLVDKSNGNGYFNTADEITNSGLSYDFGTPRVGDLIYKDLNGDKRINIKDQAPLGNGAMPAYSYSLNVGLTYKNFDFSMFLQGIGKREVIESGYGYNEAAISGIFSKFHRNAWTAERYAAGSKITFPALSSTTSTNTQASDFFLSNRAYLRLKNIEIGYTLHSALLKKANIEKFRILLSGQNLLTFHSMMSTEYGPEGNYTSIPVYKNINVGLQLNF